MKTILQVILLISLQFIMVGCSIKESFPGSTSDQVWTAMKATAQSPDYQDAHYTKRWTIIDNFVDIDEESHVIEIDRSLERVLQRPMTNPLYEKSSWIFTVELIDGDPPVASIHNRGVSLPTKFQFEAERFFSEMRMLLKSPDSDPAVD